MSVNNALVSEEYQDTVIPSTSAVTPGDSGNISNTIPWSSTKGKESSKYNDSYLEVPSYHPSRASLDSAFSDISELSLHSNELRTNYNDPLLQHSTSIQNEDAVDASSSYRSHVPSVVHRFWIANYGAFLVVLAQFFGCIMNLATRLLETPGQHGEPMHPFQILFARQSITAALCTTFALKTGSIPDFPLGAHGIRWLLVIRGLCGFFGVFGLYFCLLYLPLAEATVLTFLAPILTCYLCSFTIKGETFSRQQQLAGLLSLVGVVFIAHPGALFASISSSGSDTSSSGSPSAPEINARFALGRNSTSTPEGTLPDPTPSQRLSAIGVAMIGVLGATGALTSIRAIGTRAHPFLSINYFSVWCSIVSLFGLIVVPGINFRLPGNLLEWSLLASLGFCGFIMQFLLTAGLAYGGPSSMPANEETEDVENSNSNGRTSRHQEKIDTTKSLKKGSGNRATSMMYTQMLFALAGDKVVFSITPGAMSWIGSGLILAGAIWVAAAKNKNDSAEANMDNNNAAHREDSISVADVVNGGGSTSRIKWNARGHVDREEEVGLMTIDKSMSDDENDDKVPGESLEMKTWAK